MVSATSIAPLNNLANFIQNKDERLGKQIVGFLEEISIFSEATSKADFIS